MVLSWAGTVFKEGQVRGPAPTVLIERLFLGVFYGRKKCDGSVQVGR